jgi:hypothetical protein
VRIPLLVVVAALIGINAIVAVQSSAAATSGEERAEMAGQSGRIDRA